MAAEEFRRELRQRRKDRHWSQARLARESGVSTPMIAKYEAAKVTSPGRHNVICLAQALGWDVDTALALVGEGPLSDDERALMPVRDRKAELDRLWVRLPARQQAAIADLVVALVEPQGPGLVVPGPRVTEGPDPAASHRSRVDRGPVDPNHNNDGAPHPVNGGSVDGR